MASHEPRPGQYPAQRNTETLSRRTIALLGAAALSIALMNGCKSSPPAPETPAPVATQAPVKPQAVPYTRKHLYSTTADPHADIAAGIKQAKREHKRVLLDFGGDWCGDCQVLDIYFHQSPNSELLKNFVVVHIYIGETIDQNLDLGEKYGVPLKKGVPALAVLDSTGKVIYSQKTGEFEDMRHMNSQSVTDFLERWKS